jgi:hypothetical protein
VRFSFFYIATLFSGIPNFLMRVYLVSAETMYLIKKKVVYINVGKKKKKKKKKKKNIFQNSGIICNRDDM